MDQELPLEMISEILIRTLLDALDRCKKVSNGWKELIYDSTFFPFYLERNSILFGFFVQDNTKIKPKFIGIQSREGCINKSWLSGDVRILASCNHGIVCCDKKLQNYENYRWYVGKPATEQWKAISNPKLRYKTVGVAIIVSEPKPLRFKIIRLSEMEIDAWLDMEYACEVFDSKTWDWRRTRSVFLPYNEFIDTHQSTITVGDQFVYWKTYSDNVVAFDVTKQHFDKFTLPETSASGVRRLVEYQGELGVSCSTQDGNILQLWITNSKNNYEWRRKMNVDISVVEDTVTYPYLIGFCNTNTSFMKAFNEVVFFNVEDGTFIRKELDFDLRFARQFFQFCSDVERVDLRCVDQDRL